MKFFKTLLLILLFFSNSSCSQENKKDNSINGNGYTIDVSLKKMMEKKKIKESHASLDIQWLENGKETMFPLSGKDTPCDAYYTLSNDTIKITAMTMMGTIGIIINLYKDSVWMFHFVVPKDRSLRSFKRNITDKVYQYGPDAPAKFYKLVFTEVPKPNEPIEGYVEFESVDFYQKWNTGDIKRAYNAKGYFRAIYR